MGVEDGGRDTGTVDKFQVRGREEVEGLSMLTFISTLLKAVQHDRRWDSGPEVNHTLG